MFRKLCFAGLAGLGLLSVAPAADAMTGHRGVAHSHPRRVARYHRGHYRIMYRKCATDPWAFYGRYDGRGAAYQAARVLRQGGCEVFIR